MRSRPVIKQINTTKVRSRVNEKEVVRLVDEWNKLVILLNQELVRAHGEILDRRCGDNCPPEKLVEIYGLWRDNLRKNQGIREIISRMRNTVEELKDRARKLSPSEKLYILRLARRLERSIGLSTYLVSQDSSGNRVVGSLYYIGVIRAS